MSVASHPLDIKRMYQALNINSHLVIVRRNSDLKETCYTRSIDRLLRSITQFKNTKMRHHNLQLVIIGFLGLISVTLVQSQERCVNPIGQTGICINIRECKPLIELLRRYRNSVGEFLRSSVCGFDASDPRVCCVTDGGINRNENPMPPTESIVTPTTPTQRSNRYGPLYGPSCGVSNNTFTRVVGGVPAKLGAWPWLAALGYRVKRPPSDKPKFLCGGSLISSRHVLTAAHCLNGDLFVVRLGDLDLNDDVQDGASPITVPIAEKHRHPRYSDTQITNDIAVLKLEWDVDFSDVIRPICLPLVEEVANKNFANSLPFVAGWGSIYFRGPTATHLQQLQVPVVQPDNCRAAFSRFKQTIIDDRVMCAGYAKGGQDACKGDSGGPLMYPKNKFFYAIGVVSFGYRCAEPGIPGVYTRVTQFLDFIQSHLN